MSAKIVPQLAGRVFQQLVGKYDPELTLNLPDCPGTTSVAYRFKLPGLTMWPLGFP